MLRCYKIFLCSLSSEELGDERYLQTFIEGAYAAALEDLQVSVQLG